MDPSVKLEDGVKPEPDMGTPELMDEDIYEDTGDLSIPTENTDVWLTRVPKYLWEAISNLDDDAMVEVGTLKVWGDINDPKNHQSRLQMKPDWKTLDDIPKHYTLSLNNVQKDFEKPSNTYVFTEKDQPGFNRFARGTRDTGTSKPGDSSRVQKPRQRGRRAIPKATALVGAVKMEVACNPLENAEYRNYERRKNAKQKKEASVMDTTSDIRVLNQQATAQANRVFSNFVAPAAQKPKANIDDRAARIPQNELLDMLVRIMESGFKYWPLKELKRRTRQPEAYLKDTLQQVAVLVKSGPFANNWTLKEQYVVKDQTIKEEAAPDEGGSDEEVKEEDGSFEDVGI